MASQEVIKELGTNGGGFYNANSAHPFENPTAWTNRLEIFLIGLIPFSLPRVFGRMVGDKRQGWRSSPPWASSRCFDRPVNVTELAHPGTVPHSVGASMEGREVRFGTGNSATFAAMTTLTSTGSVDSFHDSYSGLGGGILMFNMMLGEVAPGGVGSGLYGMLVLAIITVFVAGLMVGRTPEYLGKKLGAREMKLASLYFLITPFLVLVGTAAGDGERGPAGLDAQHRHPRLLRGAVRLHLGQQQQRLGVRRHHGEHPVVRPGARPVHAAGPVPADRARARAGRQPRPADPGSGVGRHHADPHSPCSSPC